MPVLPATALTNPILVGPTITLMVSVMSLPHSAEGSAKAKPELGPVVSLAFLHISALITGARSKLSI